MDTTINKTMVPVITPFKSPWENIRWWGKSALKKNKVGCESKSWRGAVLEGGLRNFSKC